MNKILFFCFSYIFIVIFPLNASNNTITVMSFNLWNYFIKGSRYAPVKKEESKTALIKVIKKADPDIIMISEIGGSASLEDLKSRLKDYPFSTVMHGADKSRYIGCVAKFTPESVKIVNDLTYKIKPKFKDKKSVLENVYVQRGFLHIIFIKGSYKLHIINAHLKARLFHYRYNQTDMRRMEARLLKYYVNSIIKKDPEANILVVGDLNDVYSSNPLVTLRGSKQKAAKRLYDLKPRDTEGASWTHWWKVEDTYGRIDYLLASPALLPEIEFDKNKIPHNSKIWLYASDHRPVCAVINCEDKKLWSENKINLLFKNGIYSEKKE